MGIAYLILESHSVNHKQKLLLLKSEADYTFLDQINQIKLSLSFLGINKKCLWELTPSLYNQYRVH